MADRRTRSLTGWGRSVRSPATVVDVGSAAEVSRLLADPAGPPVLARGLGRSYGDAALNRDGLVLVPGHRRPAPHVDGGCVTADGGASVAELLAATLPLGYCLPVLPGTRHVTLGGAVAADVHGKNHHRDGSLGRWLEEIVLVDGTGGVRRLSRRRDPALFFATLGGMGLTGVVVAATLRLLPVRTGWLRVRTRRLSWDDLLAAMSTSDARYHVAWLDLYAGGRSWGRGVLDEADHAGPDELPAPARAAPLRYRPKPAPPAPPSPGSVVTRTTARLFGELWWRRAPADGYRVRPLPAFFAPLDAVAGWNRLYGPRGFLQYQFAVPFGAEPVLERSARLLAGTAPFLPVLKRLGDASGGHLSFPLPGWTLAVDVPTGTADLQRTLRRVDELVASAGGRVYLAKDARLSPELFAAMYPRLPEWRAARDRLDPHRRIRSDLGGRLGLC